MNIETFLSHFDHVKAAGPEEWSCECPTHDDDDHKSLSIGHKGDKILVYCHAGCNTEDVLAAKGLTMADLKNGQKPAPVIGREVCAYDYVDEDGNLIYQNVRLKLPKEFYFRRPNAKGGWIKNLGGVKRTIYRLPAVIEAARAGGLILWVEGEKDADNATTLGFTATTGGSATSWQSRFADYFTGGQVVVIADLDGPGKKHAREIYAGLKGVAASVKYLELPGPGKDLTNWLDAGGTADALTTLINDADEGEPPPLASTTVATDEKREYRNTELGLRERFVDEYKGKVKFAHSGAGRGTWVFYDGGRWQYDNTKRASEKMVAIVKKLQLAWLKMEPGTEKNELMKFLVKAETHRTVEAALELASHSTDMACEAAEFDSKLCFLNVENGTLDLRTGELQPHDPGDYLTQYVEHPYIRWSDIPDEQKAEWLKFLFTVCSGDQEQVGYLQKCIGYSLRGDLGERVFFFIYGPGGNGKTQLFIALINVIGKYGGQAKAETFMVRKFTNNGPDDAVAALKGVRLLIAAELSQGRTLDTELIKKATGGESLWHEKKFQGGFNFKPAFTLWMYGNHEPRISDTTDSIYDRLIRFPFDYRVPENEKVQNYGEKLAAKYPEVILSWAVEGALRYEKEGLGNQPKSVKDAGTEYRERQDALASYVNTKLVKTPGKSASLSEVYANYQSYAADPVNDIEEPLTKRQFNKAMIERGFAKKRGTGGEWVWRGITLVTEVTEGTQILESSSHAPAGESSPNISTKSNLCHFYEQKPMTDPAPEPEPVAILDKRAGMVEAWRAIGSPKIQLDECCSTDNLETFLFSESPVKVRHLAAIQKVLAEGR